MAESHQVITSRLASLLESGQYSDLTIKVGEEQFHVHRMMICPESKFFEAACNGKFREAQDGIIDLSADDKGAVKRVLKYLYTANYDDEDPAAAIMASQSNTTPVTPQEDDSSPSVTWPGISTIIDRSMVAGPSRPNKIVMSTMLNNVLVYKLADMYGIQPLKELALHKFRMGSLNEWDNETIITVLRAIDAATPVNDVALRNSILDVCERYTDQVMSSQDILDMFEKDASLASGMLIRVHKAKRQDSEKLRQKEKESKSALQSLKDRLKSSEHWARAEHQMLKELICRHAKCQGCVKPLDLSVRRGRNARTVSFKLRCIHCGKLCVE
ncbi:MAG: hypothetical protein LQ341_000467 [Variospora aurantia]|nr:MAG: hypothetical protein LQ341_000467 [Variospora aurantia]